MGAYLSQPITDLVAEDGRSSKLVYGSAAMQGWRVSQEDAHIAIEEFDKSTDTSLFAVFDGHGGPEVAQYCAQHLPNFIKSLASYQNTNIVESLEEAFLKFDNTLTKPEDEEEDEDEESSDDDMDDEDSGLLVQSSGGYEEPGRDSGCTAVVALLRGNDLYVANAGDSRCVVSRNGKAIEMSIDHKPEDEIERTRVEKAGGKVTPDGRVNGGLNLSRAIGDHAYKDNTNVSDREQMITALPDIKTLSLEIPNDKFMVIACDGIWNSLTSQQVVDFVGERIDKVQKLSTICDE
ncbi:unnamed protein product, partial [Sphagnum jensenii]